MGVDWADHFDWANAYFVYREQNSTRPVIVSEAELTPSLGLRRRIVQFAQHAFPPQNRSFCSFVDGQRQNGFA